MCWKLYKKMCCILGMIVVAGGALCFLRAFLCAGGESGDALMREVKEKKEKIKDACQSVKSRTKDIADEVKFAAEYSAEEMKEGWKHSGEAVKAAAENIKEDMRGMKDGVGSVFEDGEDA